MDASLTEHIIIAEQRPENDGDDGYYRDDQTLSQRLFAHTPDKCTHQQRSQQPIKANKQIEHTSADEYIDGTQIIFCRQQSEEPHRANGQCGADCCYKEMTTQFQVIDPIAHVDIHDDNGSQRNQQHGRPLDGDAEGAPDDQQQHCPPQRQQGHAQCRMIEKLREITAQPRQQPA